MNILITGANGFVGRNLLYVLKKNKNLKITTVSRSYTGFNDYGIDNKLTFEINQNTEWKNILKNIDCVIHLACNQHKIISNIINLKNYSKADILNSKKLINDCKLYKVKKFIYLSSAQVYGEKTKNKRLSINSSLKPITNYADSKVKIENMIHNIFTNSNTKYTIIRPPLVYGKNNAGNFNFLLKIIKLGIPLPLKDVHNKRSVISIYNLVDLINFCIFEVKSNNKTLIVSDNCDISIQDIVNFVLKKDNFKIIIFKIPKIILNFLSSVPLVNRLLDKIYSDFQLDISETLNLGWEPKYTFEKSMNKIFTDNEV